MNVVNRSLPNHNAVLAALALVVILTLTAWIEAGAFNLPNSSAYGISFANVSSGAVLSKENDVDTASELVDITLEVIGDGVPDGTGVLVKVQGSVTVGGQAEPGIVNEYTEMSSNYSSVVVPLFPGENTINVYLLPDGPIGIYTPRVIGRIMPSATVTVSSSHLSVGDDLTSLITEDQYNQITADSRNCVHCYENNRAKLGLPDDLNGQWYYTYENFINAMRKVPKFAGEGDLNTRKLELAAFFANVAQETGAGGAYGAGCAIQEGRGDYWDNPNFGGLAPTGAGYAGRGPIQLTHRSNYQGYGEDMGVEDLYVNDPDILTKDPAVGLAGSMWFWNSQAPQWDGSMDPPFKPSCHEVMVHTWQPTDNDISAGRTVDRDFGVVINIINGGLECDKGGDGSEKARNRVSYYRAIAAILGAEIPASQTDAELNCADQKRFDLCPSSPAYPPCL